MKKKTFFSIILFAAITIATTISHAKSNDKGNGLEGVEENPGAVLSPDYSVFLPNCFQAASASVQLTKNSLFIPILSL